MSLFRDWQEDGLPARLSLMGPLLMLLGGVRNQLGTFCNVNLALERQAIQEGSCVQQSQHSDPQGFTGTRQGGRPSSPHFTPIPKGRSVQSMWDEVVGLAIKVGVQLQRVMLYCVQRAQPSWPQGQLCTPLGCT